MARDYVAEIEALKNRNSRHFSSAPFEVAVLGRAWTSAEQGSVLRGDLFVIRLVTILEVATRAWVAALIDHGDPYLSRASDLFKRSGIKIDFDTAQAITRERITLGDLVAHTLSTNSVGDIDAALTPLLDGSPKHLLRDIKDPWEERSGTTDPIIKDPDRSYRILQRLFESRHIVVHELPVSPPYEEAEVEEFISEVLAFVSAVDVLLAQAIGSTALTQLEINDEAAAKGRAAQERLAEILRALDPDKSDDELQAAQTAWEAYREAHANYRSGIKDELSGSIAPLLWWTAYETATEARIEELEWMTTAEEGMR